MPSKGANIFGMTSIAFKMGFSDVLLILASMNYRILFFLFLTFLLSCEKKERQGYSISADLENIRDGIAYLVKLDLSDNSTQYIDTAKILNGRFNFNGVVDHPYPHTIYLNSKEEKIHLFLDNSEIIINGFNDNLADIKVSGSREDSLFRSWFNHSLFKFTPDLDIIFNHSDYSLAPFVAFYHVQSYPTSLDSMQLMLTQFKGSIKDSEYYLAFEKLVAQSAKVAIDQPAPLFILPDTLGNNIALENIESKLILIDFWASWCKPCRAANPTLVELYAKYHPKGLEIIGISVDEDRAKWVKAIKKDKLEWTQLSELKGWNTKVTNDYAIKAVPQNYLLDSNGIILAKNIEPQNLEQKILQHLSND